MKFEWFKKLAQKIKRYRQFRAYKNYMKWMDDCNKKHKEWQESVNYIKQLYSVRGEGDS
jgi:hypothetical protein